MGVLDGIFGEEFEAIVKKATSKYTKDLDIKAINHVCKRTAENDKNARKCLKAISKRLLHQHPLVVDKTIILLDSCSVKAGYAFRKEMATDSFLGVISHLILNGHRRNAKHMTVLLEKWTQSTLFKEEGLDSILSLEHCLGDTDANTMEQDTDQERQDTEQERKDTEQAIALSLMDDETTQTMEPDRMENMPHEDNLYPIIDCETNTAKALNDFEAGEDNELSFCAGDVIEIINDSDMYWWKGVIGNKEGMFPASFVTKDMTVDVANEKMLQKQNYRKIEDMVKRATNKDSKKKTQKDIAVNEVVWSTSLNDENISRCVKAITKRLKHNNPSVVGNTLDLLDVCFSAIGYPFQKEMAKEAFVGDVRELILNGHCENSQHAKSLIEKWVGESSIFYEACLGLIFDLDINLKDTNGIEKEIDMDQVSTSSDEVRVDMNENKINDLLNLLYECETTDSTLDSDRIEQLEKDVEAMEEDIHDKWMQEDMEYVRLRDISNETMNALSMYHTLMDGENAKMEMSKNPIANLITPMPLFQEETQNHQIKYDQNQPFIEEEHNPQ